MHPVEVMRWVDAYERAWRAGDLDALETLFTDQARYRFWPYEESQVGHAAIKGFWQDDDEQPGV